MSKGQFLHRSILELPQVRVMGRKAGRTQPQPLFWAASGLDFVCTGSELWVEFDAAWSVQEPWISVEINGAWIARLPITQKGQWVCIYTGMQAGQAKRVRIFKDNQAMSADPDHLLCAVSMRWREGQILPPPAPALRIEFVGDSLTSGEGVIGSVEETDWTSAFFSSMQCYTKQTADRLNAEFRTVSQGGWGILAGWDNDPRSVLSAIYDPVCACARSQAALELGAGHPAAEEGWQADVVVLNLGTNDYGASGRPSWLDPVTGQSYGLRRTEGGLLCAEDALRLHQAMVKLLGQVRQMHPGARLVWCYGMIPGGLFGALRQGLESYRKNTGDSCDLLRLPAVTDETMGARWHPGPGCHAQAARVLADWIGQTSPSGAETGI